MVTNFNEACEQLTNEMWALTEKESPIGPVVDGIINVDNYLKAKYRILWILKESNDVVDGKGGHWNLVTKLNEAELWENQPQTGATTIKRMVYASYGILNGFAEYQHIPSINYPEVLAALKQIGYINVKKIPGGSTANGKEIQKAYIDNRDLLLRQINTYNPDIIITGNTLQYFFNDLPIPFDNKKYVNSQTGNTAYYPDKDRIYIHAYHPAVWASTINEEDYCNEIILAAKDWAENYK